MPAEELEEFNNNNIIPSNRKNFKNAYHIH